MPALPEESLASWQDLGSDNHGRVHPDVLEAIAAANEGHATSYGGDPWTARAEGLLKAQFGEQVRPFLVLTGGGANLGSIAATTSGFEAVICSDVAHMHLDECGAIERVIGTKLLTVPVEHGKLTADDVGRWEARRGDEHSVQPRVVSITQATDVGTVYSLEETRAIVEAAHDLGMFVHVDGARLANAAAALDVSLGDLTTAVGVDVVSFGGTKNGLLAAEAVVFCNERLGRDFVFTRKQLGQLASKMRYVAAQFEALLDGDLWRRNAQHANAMAARLVGALETIDEVEIVHPVQTNFVFARLPHTAVTDLLSALPGQHPFHVWEETTGEIRLVCGWDTVPADVDLFVAAVEATTARAPT